MPKYLVTYIGTAASRKKVEWDEMDQTKQQARQQEAMMAWGQWMQTHEDFIVDTGGPIGPTKRASPDGIKDTTNQITAYVLIEAPSHQAAAEMFRDHPHFTLFPGDSIEIMECLPMPGEND